jgi:Cdc6-like AAA superfamily ATPase
MYIGGSPGTGKTVTVTEVRREIQLWEINEKSIKSSKVFSIINRVKLKTKKRLYL